MDQPPGARPTTPFSGEFRGVPTRDTALTVRQRWRLLLGEDGPGERDPEGDPTALPAQWQRLDEVVGDLYEEDRRGTMAKSSAKLTEWLGRLRENFPPESIEVMQKDALDRFGLTQLLTDPAILGGLEPDVHLAATLIQLGKAMPDATRAKAEQIIAHVARQLSRKLEEPLLRSVRSAIAAAELRTQSKPTRHTAWGRTILKNLKHYQPSLGTVVPERFVNRAPLARGLRNVHVLVDQSASMATSAIHAALGAAIMAKVPALRVRLVAFDTEIADLSGLLHDPVETLFGVQLGGGTDIHRALGYEEQYIREPSRTLLVLLSDLHEGGSRAGTVQRVDAMIQSGVRVVCLLAISEAGKPSYDKAMAGMLTELGASAFSTTPDAFAEMMGRALRGESVG